MAQWYFKVGSYEVPPPDKLSYELYPQSDLIRLADYSMVGRFVSVAEKMNFSYNSMLESDRHELFLNLMGYDAQNAWFKNNRKFVYRMGSKVRQMDAYLGAISQEFANNFMGAETDNWIWSDIGFSVISSSSFGSELYDLGGS